MTPQELARTTDPNRVLAELRRLWRDAFQVPEPQREAFNGVAIRAAADRYVALTHEERVDERIARVRHRRLCDPRCDAAALAP